MKKRSVLSAVAMLLVSALVLTSATYAWFAESTSASVAAFSSSVSNDKGSILISADNSIFKTSLVMLDYYNDNDSSGTITAGDTLKDAGTSFPATLAVCSFPINDSATHPTISGVISGTTYTTAAVGNYVLYNVYLKAAAACEVEVTASVSNANAPFVWAAVQGLDDPLVLNSNLYLSTVKSFVPVTTITAGKTATDENANYVIDSGEATADVTLGTAVTASNTAGVPSNIGTATFTAAGVKTLTIVMWAEGQDLQCNGNVSATNPSIALAFEIAD